MLLCSLCLALVPQSTEVRREAWPGGQPRAEYTVEVTADGESREGEFRSWYEDGTLESEGKYRDDRRSGQWTFHHPNGQISAEGGFSKGQETGAWELFHENGQRSAKGRYSDGLRDGVWRFWTADGEEDALETGTYAHESFRSPDGLRLYKGYRLDGERHGDWTSYWPDLAPQLEAHFVRGQRSGDWRLHAPDGHVVRALFGRYEDGAFVGRLPEDLAPPFTGEPCAIEDWPGRTLAGEAEVAAAIDELLALPGSGPEQRWKEMTTRHETPRWLRDGIEALPIVLRRLQRCDPATDGGRLAVGRLDAMALRPLCGGRSLATFDAGGPASEAEARAFVDAWTTLWAATRGERWYWTVQVPHLPLAEDDRLLREPPILGREPTAEPVEATSRDSRHRSRREGPREKALAAALDWLARAQFPDGHWEAQASPLGPTGGSRGYDCGVTGLALLALLGDGNTPFEGQHAPTVARAVQWLLRIQDPRNGAFRTLMEDEKRPGVFVWHHDWVYGHAMATQALAEVYARTGERALEAPLGRAVDLIFLGRNPYSAWRYSVPPIGDNDTLVTGWMCHALLAARDAGLERDYGPALEGGQKFVDEVTDPASGRTGYSAFGELPARTPANEHYPRERGEAPTASGLLLLLSVGRDPEENEVMAKQADLIAGKPPIWDPRTYGIDPYFWYHATRALHRMGEPWWPRWEKALLAALLDAQVEKGDGRGSWDPVGVWGYCGGRAATTALLAMCLEIAEEER